MSAGRVYDGIPDECAAVVRFITSSKVIARVLPDKKLNVKIDVWLADLDCSPAPFDMLFPPKRSV